MPRFFFAIVCLFHLILAIPKIILSLIIGKGNYQVKTVLEDYEAKLIVNGKSVAKSKWKKYGDNSVRFRLRIYQNSGLENRSYQVFLNNEFIGETKNAENMQVLLIESTDGNGIFVVKEKDIISIKLNDIEIAKGSFYLD